MLEGKYFCYHGRIYKLKFYACAYIGGISWEIKPEGIAERIGLALERGGCPVTECPPQMRPCWVLNRLSRELVLALLDVWCQGAGRLHSARLVPLDAQEVQ